MKDLSHFTYFLGLDVHIDSSDIFLNQHKYTQDLIYLVCLQDSPLVNTPMEVKVTYRIVQRVIFFLIKLCIASWLLA